MPQPATLRRPGPTPALFRMLRAAFRSRSRVKTAVRADVLPITEPLRNDDPTAGTLLAGLEGIHHDQVVVPDEPSASLVEVIGARTRGSRVATRDLPPRFVVASRATLLSRERPLGYSQAPLGTPGRLQAWYEPAVGERGESRALKRSRLPARRMPTSSRKPNVSNRPFPRKRGKPGWPPALTRLKKPW